MTKQINLKDFKEDLTNVVRKQINEQFLACETASKKDIQKAYLSGAKMVFNEMIQVSIALPEHLAEKLLKTFQEVLEEYT